MEKIQIKDVTEMIDKIVTLGLKKDICVVGYYDTIIDLVNGLIKMSDYKLLNCELEDLDTSGYDDAYYLETDKDDIWVCRGFDNERYLYVNDDIIFVEEDFVEDFIEDTKINEDRIVEFGFDDLDYSVKEDGNQNTCIDEDGCGFCFCISEDGGFTKFRYRGDHKLSNTEIEGIIDEYLE